MKFGQTSANELRRRRPRCGDKWHLDEVFLKINGKTHSLWRTVDQDGNVLDILVQSRRNTHAAKRFFRKLLKGLQYVPRVIITDKLKSYGAAKREILPGVEHQKGLDLVFCTRTGNYFVPASIEGWFNKLLENAGIEHMKFHGLRHNASLILRRLGIDPVVRKEMLGHASTDMTDGVYGHTTPKMHKEAAQEIDRLVDEGEM